jgi:hypothetical protein
MGGAVRPSAQILAKVPAGVFRQSQAARAGVSARSLYRLRDAGLVEVMGRGLYRRAGGPPVDEDLTQVAARSPRATICLSSALAHHGLIDAIPARVHVAIPRGTYAARVQAPVRWHVFDAATFELGRQMLPIAGVSDPGVVDPRAADDPAADDVAMAGVSRIGLYNAERSIVDVFRLRGQEGYEVGVEALRAWLRSPGAHPATLLALAARLPRAQGPLHQALEYLA